MSMITLAISCLTTSNLPWFMDLIFQVPMQYCIHFTCRKSNAQNSPRQTSTIYEPRLPDVQVGFRKGRRTRDQTANMCWIIEEAREFKKNIYFCFIDYAKVFDSVDHSKLWKILQEIGIPDHHLPAFWEICVQVKKQQLESDMEQCTGSKLGKKHVSAIYCHPAYWINMQSTPFKIPGCMKHKLESRLPGEISIISNIEMTPPLWQQVKRN